MTTIALPQTRDDVIALARTLMEQGETVTTFCRRLGIKPATLNSQCYRAGARLAVELRRLRVQAVLDAHRENPTRTLGSLAVELGWTEPQYFFRARRMLAARWGVRFT